MKGSRVVHALGLALVVVSTLAGPASAASRAHARSTVREIDSLVRAAHSRGQLNGVVLVAEKGRIVYERALGDADLARRTPLRTDSVFELASVTKPITAFAIMLLKERGKLSFDDALTKYFPDLPYPGVTIRHMLTHTAGLPEPEPFFGSEWPADGPVTNADFVRRLAQRKPPAYFAAGTSWRYDRTAYFLLARIVELVSGTSYAQFLRDNVFRPLGMKHSFVVDTERMGRIPHLANGYTHASFWSDDYVRIETLPRYSYSTYFGNAAGAMGVYSSVEDLFVWVQALRQGKLIRKDALREAFTPVKLDDGSTASAGGGAGNGLPSGYGLGWFVQDGRDGKTIRHTGDWRGSITCLIHNLDRDQTIVVLTNANDFAAIDVASGIENILDGRPYALPVRSIARVVGKAIFARGIDAAVALYRELKSTRPNDYAFKSDGELNSLGYALLRNGNTREAVEVFKLNVEAFPESWNVYDSLAEAYLALGDKELAVKNYRRSVELNPDNRNGLDALEKLGAAEI